MASDTDALVNTLRDDLSRLDERLADDEFATELYRALASRAWSRADGPDGHVALSWTRAEELVNELRRQVGQAPLALAQTGGEGEVASVVGEELQRLGWRSAPLNTDRHDDAHVGQAADSPPPADTGARMAPPPNTRDWEREAHEEAGRARRERG
jgi:alkylated DNA repair dioxygenase AlkB